MRIHETAAVTGLTIDTICRMTEVMVTDSPPHLPGVKCALACGWGFGKDWPYTPRCSSKLRTSAAGA